MPPRTNRFKIHEQKQSATRNTMTLEDYEKQLLKEIEEELARPFDQMQPPRDFHQDKSRRVLQLSMMHQHLRKFQLNQ